MAKSRSTLQNENFDIATREGKKEIEETLFDFRGSRAFCSHYSGYGQFIFFALQLISFVFGRSLRSLCA